MGGFSGVSFFNLLFLFFFFIKVFTYYFFYSCINFFNIFFFNFFNFFWRFILLHNLYISRYLFGLLSIFVFIFSTFILFFDLLQRIIGDILINTSWIKFHTHVTRFANFDFSHIRLRITHINYFNYLLILFLNLIIINNKYNVRR
jgi:hypothetical protein